VNALRLVWGGVLCVPHIRVLGAYNGALASGVCLRIPLSVRRPSSALYIWWWARLQCVREGGSSPPEVGLQRVRSAVLHVSCPGPVVERALPLPEAKSCPPSPRCRLTRP
jgi:hypothetical protein